MRISNTLLTISAAALLVSPVCLRADDSEAQIRAREALRKKMQELDTKNAPTNEVKPAEAPKPAPEPAPVAPKPQPAPAPAPQAEVKQIPPPVAATPQTEEAPPPRSSPDNPALQEALRKKIQQLEGQQPAEAATAAAPAPARTTETQGVPAAPAATDSVAQNPSAKPEDIQRAREAMRNRLTQLNNEQPLPDVQPERRSGSHVPSFEPLKGPGSGLSTDKEQKLAALLTKYKADEITPSQYHAERAKILAEP